MKFSSKKWYTFRGKVNTDLGIERATLHVGFPRRADGEGGAVVVALCRHSIHRVATAGLIIENTVYAWVHRVSKDSLAHHNSKYGPGQNMLLHGRSPNFMQVAYENSGR